MNSLVHRRIALGGRRIRNGNGEHRNPGRSPLAAGSWRDVAQQVGSIGFYRLLMLTPWDDRRSFPGAGWFRSVTNRIRLGTYGANAVSATTEYAWTTNELYALRQQVVDVAHDLPNCALKPSESTTSSWSQERGPRPISLPISSSRPHGSRRGARKHRARQAGRMCLGQDFDAARTRRRRLIL